MARPREFEIDDAERRMLEVFWTKGYDGTSMSDIEAVTRLKKQSLYRVFENKRGMYLAALAAYERDHVAAAQEVLQAAPDAKSGFAALLEGVVDSAITLRDRRGCFLCNASVDQAPHDPATAARVATMIEGLEDVFTAALKRGQGKKGQGKKGQGKKGQGKKKARALARKLMAGYFGLRVLIKSGAPEAVLRDAAGQMLADIDG